VARAPRQCASRGCLGAGVGQGAEGTGQFRGGGVSSLWVPDEVLQLGKGGGGLSSKQTAWSVADKWNYRFLYILLILLHTSDLYNTSRERRASSLGALNATQCVFMPPIPPPPPPRAAVGTPQARKPCSRQSCVRLGRGVGQSVVSSRAAPV
jgi:hypothetical protein